MGKFALLRARLSTWIGVAAKIEGRFFLRYLTVAMLVTILIIAVPQIIDKFKKD